MEAKTRNRLLLASAAFAIGLLAISQLRAPTQTPYTRGLSLARDIGCIGCHGEAQQGTTPNPSRDASTPRALVPPLIGCALPPAEFKQWVLEGVSDALANSPRWKSVSAARAIQMPAYRDDLDEAEVADLHAWAVISGAGELDAGLSAWGRAEKLAREHGCFDCHGPLGQGGVSNPGSFTGVIPALTGDDFEHLTDGANPDAIREWIANGESDLFLEGSPIAFIGRSFMRDQRAQMPSFAGILTEEEIELLVNYCVFLCGLGPLDAHAHSHYKEELRSHDGSSDQGSSTGTLPPAVAQIFSQACVRCHGPKKQKSGYRIDTSDGAFAQGDIAEYLEREPLSPGRPDDSLLFTFITATEEDDENEIYPMPPDEKERLSEKQINLIREWIESGAPWTGGDALPDTHTD